jgi:hypothetical protein
VRRRVQIARRELELAGRVEDTVVALRMKGCGERREGDDGVSSDGERETPTRRRRFCFAAGVHPWTTGALSAMRDERDLTSARLATARPGRRSATRARRRRRTFRTRAPDRQELAA